MNGLWSTSLLSGSKHNNISGRKKNSINIYHNVCKNLIETIQVITIIVIVREIWHMNE